ncbi:outer membrane protein assembly factor BamE domain-containing protein [Vibrio parahaemolyticus]
MKNIIFSFIAALLITGCAQNKIDYGKASLQLELGMSKQEVINILGEPKRTDVTESRTRWVYWNPETYGFTTFDNELLSSDSLVVTFEDGEVAKWGKSNLGPDMEEIYEQQQKLYSNPIKTEVTIKSE